MYFIVLLMFLVLLKSVLGLFFPDRFSGVLRGEQNGTRRPPLQLYLEVNIPEGALYVYQFENERQLLLKKYPCSVGTIAFKTPQGDFLSSEVVWNPGWVPPSSNWAKDLKPAAPGKESPLGTGALVVDWDEELMIHASQDDLEVGRPASHGCIRLREKDMTELLAFIQNSIPNSKGMADLSYYKQHPYESVRVDLYRPVAINLVYRRTEKAGRQVVMHPDIYTYGSVSVNIDPVRALQKNMALDAVILEFSPESVSAPVQTIAAAPDRIALRKNGPFKRYYRSVKLHFFVWYINAKGEVASWSKLRPKP